jgi:hypothetical protein
MEIGLGKETTRGHRQRCTGKVEVRLHEYAQCFNVFAPGGIHVGRAAAEEKLADALRFPRMGRCHSPRVKVV